VCMVSMVVRQSKTQPWKGHRDLTHSRKGQGQSRLKSPRKVSGAEKKTYSAAMSRGRGYVPRGLGSFSSPNRGRGSISSLSHLGSLSGFSRGGFGAGRGGGGNFSTGPPDQVFGTIPACTARSNVLEMGSFLHASEGDMLYESTNPKIPYFNAPIFLENKVNPSP